MLGFPVLHHLLEVTPIELVMQSNYFILCLPLHLLTSIFPSIRAFSNELALLIRWLKYWRFAFSISSSNEYSGLISNKRAPGAPAAWADTFLTVAFASQILLDLKP